MDLLNDKLALAVGGVLLAIAGFVVRWGWDRWWGKADATVKKLDAAEKAATAAREQRIDDSLKSIDGMVREHNDRLAAVESAQQQAHQREEDRIKTMGRLEGEHNRLDGKVDALQTFWRSEFAKLTEQFKEFEGKVEFRLDNFRLELRGDQQKSEERLTQMLTAHLQRESNERAAHQERIHDRLNIISSEQASMLNELVDRFVDKAGEPRLSPPKVT